MNEHLRNNFESSTSAKREVAITAQAGVFMLHTLVLVCPVDTAPMNMLRGRVSQLLFLVSDARQSEFVISSQSDRIT